LVSADILAVGFTKKNDDTIELAGNSRLIASLEKYFEISLVDEIAFFQPSGKAGELFEIPVLHKDSTVDRIYIVAVGDGALPALRTAGAALGRKVRGKAIELVSLIAESRL
jgi:hypothetical protein